MHSPRVRRTLPVVLAVNAVLLVLAGCWRGPTARPPSPSPSAGTRPAAFAAAAPVSFVGSAACAECHPKEYRTQSQTRHAHTLKVMTPEGLGPLAPQAGVIPGTGLTLLRKGARFGIGLTAHPGFALPLDYAIGSGRTGMTYISLIDGKQVAEVRTSYFPHQKKWFITPGDEDLATGALARLLPPEDARVCFHCHAVMPSAQTVVPARRFFGVGCESCHGPGGAHIALMRAGRYGHDRMADLSRSPSLALLNLCGECHGSAQSTMSGAGAVTMTQTNRFEPPALAQSQCFRQSRGTLSCSTCHDPHTNVSTSIKTYDAICLTCHTTQTARRPPALRSVPIKLCPVNQIGRCVTCHMPKEKLMTAGMIPTMTADHYIRVHP